MDRTGTHARTRRRYLRDGGAVLAGLAIAGCSGGDGNGTDPTTTDGATPTQTATQTETPEGTTTDGGGTTYSVSMAPVGEVTFDGVPQTWVANNGSWGDMGVALGLEPPKGVWLTSRYHTQYYDSIPKLSVDTSEMVSLSDNGVSKELLYDLDADVHTIDPNFLMNRFDAWSESDVAEIRDNVGPFFANSIFAQHYGWHADYRYYTLYEAFEKLAQVFQRTDRYAAFEGVRDDFRSNLAPVVPAPGDRPEVAVLWGVGDQPTEYYPYVIDGGTSFKHFRDLGVRDALASTDIQDFRGRRAAIDLETVAQIDPEVLMLRGYEAKTREEFQNTVVAFLEDHQLASTLTAVENGDVYRAGGLYQGPITNMVLTERTATQLYGVDRDLFDRERVAEIVAGDS